MIVQNITRQIGEAMKAKDVMRLSVLRMLSSEFNYEKINKQHELTDDEELAVVRREVKKRKDAIDAYTKVGAKDRADAEKSEMDILMEYLPPQMSDEETEALVNSTIEEMGATTMADMGKVIGAVKAKNPNVDGSKVAGLVKQKLS